MNTKINITKIKDFAYSFAKKTKELAMRIAEHDGYFVFAFGYCMSRIFLFNANKHIFVLLFFVLFYSLYRYVLSVEKQRFEEYRINFLGYQGTERSYLDKIKESIRILNVEVSIAKAIYWFALVFHLLLINSSKYLVIIDIVLITIASFAFAKVLFYFFSIEIPVLLKTNNGKEHSEDEILMVGFLTNKDKVKEIFRFYLN
jgi:hypothetical protein